MEVLSTRLSTFSHSRTKKHNIPAHAAWPLSPSQYPRLLPELLAEAGWFYTPSKEDPDLVTCFLCGKQVGGWGEEDDPFEEHVGHQEGKCGWARTKCLVESQKRKGGQGSGEVLKARFTDASELPQSKALESARLSTFGKWWPHDKKKAWLPTSKNLAKAGFIFSPNGKASDMASCLYCELGLDGWSPTDDPFHEHQVRTPKCPFFIATVYVPPKAGTAAAKAEEQEENEGGEDDDEEEFEMIDAPVMKTPATSGKGKKAVEKAPSTVATTKSVASTKSRSTRTAKDPEFPTTVASASTSRHTRTGSTTSQPASQLGRSTRAQPQPSVEPSQNGDEPDAAPLGRSTRGKAAPAVSAPAPKRGGRGKRAVLEEEATPAPENEEEEELDLVVEEEVEEEAVEEKPVGKGKGKGSAAAAAAKKAANAAKGTAARGAKGKKAAVVVEEEEEEEVDEEMIEDAEEVEEEEDKVMSDPPAPPLPSKLPSSSKSHSRNPSASSTTAKSKSNPLPDLPPPSSSSAKPKPHPSSSSTLTTAGSSSSTTKSKPQSSQAKPSSSSTKALNKTTSAVAASSSSSRIPTPVKSPLPKHLAAPTPLRGSPFNTKEFETAKAQAVAEGARSAEKVVQTWAKMFSPAPAPPTASSSRKAGPAAGTPLAGRGGLVDAAAEDQEEEEDEVLVVEEEEETNGGKGGEVSLTEQQGSILVEEWVRMEYQLRHDELKRFGEEEKIGAFVKAAAEARRRLVEDIEVEEEE